MYKTGDRVELTADIVSHSITFAKGNRGTVITDYEDGDVSVEWDDPTKLVLSYIFVVKKDVIKHVKG